MGWGPRLSGELYLYRRGAGSEAKIKVCASKTDLQISGPFDKFFFLRKNFLMWVGAWVRQRSPGCHAIPPPQVTPSHGLGGGARLAGTSSLPPGHPCQNPSTTIRNLQQSSIDLKPTSAPECYVLFQSVSNFSSVTPPRVSDGYWFAHGRHGSQLEGGGVNN